MQVHRPFPFSTTHPLSLTLPRRRLLPQVFLPSHFKLWAIRYPTTSFLTATTLIYAIGAGITAGAGTRLVLQLLLVKGFKLYSFHYRPQMRHYNGISCHYLPVSGLGNLRACCLPWKWQPFLRLPLQNRTLIPCHPLRPWQTATVPSKVDRAEICMYRH